MKLDFYDFFWQMKEIGVGDVFIPFLLIFTILYALLQGLSIFGKTSTSKKISVVLSLVMALLVVMPHVTGDYPPGKDVVLIINQAIPGIVGFIIAVIMFFILVEAFGGTKPNLNNLGGIFVILSIIVILVIFGNAAGWFGSNSSTSSGWLNFLSDPDVATFIVIILVFGLVLWLIVHEPNDGSGKGNGSFGQTLDKFFKWFKE
ncbi:MAG: hypothetical protein PWP03_848 [Candidatus Woesearchaeota archaeon]|nr:hypothetical protein [Candidatus Woesearchaeota archaeon]MDN5328210.1 hypothetical protein [Candidatus Woesearchaeota archaeon]